MLTRLKMWTHLVPDGVLSQVLHEALGQARKYIKLPKKYPNPMEKIWAQVTNQIRWRARTQLKETIEEGE